MYSFLENRTGCIYWYWHCHIVHGLLLLFSWCSLYAVRSHTVYLSFFRRSLFASSLSKRLLTFVDLHVEAVYSKNICFCIFCSLIVLLLKCWYFYPETITAEIPTKKTIRSTGYSGQLFRPSNPRITSFSSRTLVRDCPKSLRLATCILLITIGVTRGFGVCIFVASVYGFISSFRVGTAVAVVTEATQLPLVLSFQMVPFQKALKMLSYGFLLGCGACFFHSVEQLHPNERVVRKLQRLRQESSPQQLALRRVALVRALETAGVTLYCRKDQDLCHLQKALLGLLPPDDVNTPSSRVPPQDTATAEPSFWAHEAWHRKYGLSRSVAERDPPSRKLSPMLSGYKGMEDETGLTQDERNQYDIAINTVLQQYHQETTELYGTKTTTFAPEPKRRNYVIQNEHLVFNNATVNDGQFQHDPLGLARTLLVECSITAEVTAPFTSFDIPDGERGYSTPRSPDIVVFCEEASQGRETEFLLTIGNGGTSPVWKMLEETGRVRPFHTGVLTLEDLERLFSNDELRKFYQDYTFAENTH